MTTYSDSETNTYFYIRNHNNSVVALVDEDGTIAESYEYSAYGEVNVFDANGNKLDDSALGNRYTFQGREIDWSTGLYNFRARWYDAKTGRWLSKDPIGIHGGLNQYVFCGNNPVMFVDPEGNVTYLYLIGQDSKGLNLDKTAEYLSGQIELKDGDSIVIEHIKGFDDFNSALKKNKDIARITYIGHGNPGILFVGWGNDADTNITGSGGKHIIGENTYNSCAVTGLDTKNVREDAEIYLYSCYSGQPRGYCSIARSFHLHFGVPAYGGWFGTKFKKTGEPYTFGGYLKQ